MLGLAVNDLQFIVFGLKILSKTTEVRKKGATQENDDIEAIAIHLRKASARVNIHSHPTLSTVVILQFQCITIIDELIQADCASENFRRRSKIETGLILERFVA